MSKPAARLGLGTAQWGMQYGVSNRSGIPTPDSITDMLQLARTSDVELLDTAPVYGDAMQRLGSHDLSSFAVVTKIPKITEKKITKKVCEAVAEGFWESSLSLRSAKIHGLLLHDADDLNKQGGDMLWEQLEMLKEEFAITKIGVSIYDCQQLDVLLDKFPIELIQSPVNVLDQRLMGNGVDKELLSRKIEVHARSVFLQGLLLMDIAQIPSYFYSLRPLLMRWHNAAKEQGLSLSQAAMSFVKNLSFVNTMIIGVDSLEQLDRCVLDYSQQHEFDADGLECSESRFVNPTQWNV